MPSRMYMAVSSRFMVRGTSDDVVRGAVLRSLLLERCGVMLSVWVRSKLLGGGLRQRRV
jgi:hypothetical protein